PRTQPRVRADLRCIASHDPYTANLVPLHGVPLHLRHDVVVGTVILTSHHADAGSPVVRHRVVPDADLHGVPVCPTESTLYFNAIEGVAGDCVAGEGQVGDEVVIAQSEQQDPFAILPNLVVGDG